MDAIFSHPVTGFLRGEDIIETARKTEGEDH